MKLIYLLLDVGVFIIPFLYSFHKKLQFYRNFSIFLMANIPVAAVFIAWDSWFTQLGIWGFNTYYLSGLYVFNLPLEELLFFICIPFACMFTYHCLNLYFDIHWGPDVEKAIVILFSILLLGLGIIFSQKAYTFLTFTSLGVFLLVLKFLFRVPWLAKPFLIYLVLLIPFSVVNGILTGTSLSHPIVWYDNTENLSIRLLTIPVEDVFYGFELFLMHVALYEFFKNKFQPHLERLAAH